MLYADPKDPRAKENSRRHYLKNRDRYLAYARKSQEKYRELVRQRKNRPCADCGASHPYYVMDFDHREGEKKEYAIARIHVFKSLAILENEIAKCDVVCSNCHRYRTHARFRAKSEPSDKPTHDWGEKSAWRLFNATTFALTGKVMEKPAVTTRLHQVIDCVCTRH